jgi:hypothetical protein
MTLMRCLVLAASCRAAAGGRCCQWLTYLQALLLLLLLPLALLLLFLALLLLLLMSARILHMQRLPVCCGRAVQASVLLSLLLLLLLLRPMVYDPRS